MTGFLNKYFQPLILICITLFGSEIYFLNDFKLNANIDSLSYLSIALEYKNGLYHEALNGYWGPVFSWITMFFLIFVNDGLVAVKLVTAIGSVVFVISSSRIIKWFVIPELIQHLLILSIAVMSFSFYCFASSPDLWGAAFFFLLLDIQYRNRNKFNSKAVLYSSLFLVLLFLTKQYEWFVGIAFIIFTGIFEIIILKSGKSIRNIFQPIKIIFISILFLLPWIAAISLKYNKITISQAGVQNFEWYASSHEVSNNLNIFSSSKPSESALTYWDEPALIKNYQTEKITLKSFIQNINLNYFSLIRLTNYYFGYTGLFFILIIVILLFGTYKIPTQFFTSFNLFICMIIYLSGLLVITIDIRYLFQFWILLFIGGMSSLIFILQKIRLNYFFLPAAIIICIFSCITSGNIIKENIEIGQSKKLDFIIAEKKLPANASVLVLNREQIPIEWISKLKINYIGSITTKANLEFNNLFIQTNSVDFVLADDNPHKYFPKVKFAFVQNFICYGNLYKVAR